MMAQCGVVAVGADLILHTPPQLAFIEAMLAAGPQLFKIVLATVDYIHSQSANHADPGIVAIGTAAGLVRTAMEAAAVAKSKSDASPNTDDGFDPSLFREGE
jgi:hypothetical protein